MGVPEQLNLDRVLDALRPILESESIAKVGQNIKYDALVLRNAGVELAGIVDDTMVLSYLTHPESKSHGLDALASDHLNHRMIPYKELTGTGQKQIGFAEVEVPGSSSEPNRRMHGTGPR